MPVYTIRDPNTGRTMKVRGDAPPTEAELTELFASTSSGPIPASEQPPLPTYWEDVARHGTGLLKGAASVLDPRPVLRGLRERIPEQSAMFGARTMREPTLGEVAGNVRQLGEAVATDPETQGSILGMLAVPGAAQLTGRGAAAAGRAAPGAMVTTGRGLEALGRTTSRVTPYALGSSLASGNVAPALAAAVPPILRRTGGAIRRRGEALQQRRQPPAPPPAPPEVPFHERPLAAQMAELPTEGPIPETTRVGIPRMAEPPPPPPPPPPRVAPPTSRAPSLESVLDDILQDILQSEMAAPLPSRTTLPPQPGQTITPAGRPSISPSGYDELVEQAIRQDLVPPAHGSPELVPVGEEAAYNATRVQPAVRTPEEIAYETVAQRFGGGAPPVEPLPALELPAAWQGLPSDAEVAAIVARRNARTTSRPSRARVVETP